MTDATTIHLPGKIKKTVNAEISETNNNHRLMIASWTLAGAGIILVIVTVGVVVAAYFQCQSSFLEQTKFIYTSLLPLIGTWVGTILAFYFTGENFKQANKAVNEMARQITGAEKLATVKVREAMRGISNMKYLKLPSGADPSKILLVKDILDGFFDDNKVNRMPVLSASDIPQYMIHRSLVDKYVSQKLIACAGGQQCDPMTLSLKDILDDPEYGDVFKRGFATVDETATLADAKRRMEAAPDCLDVFVTRGGTAREPVIGWLTNLEIAQAEKA